MYTDGEVFDEFFDEYFSCSFDESFDEFFNEFFDNFFCHNDINLHPIGMITQDILV